MASRKTFDVAELLYIVNRRNRYSTCDAGQRDGWNSLLEDVLHKTGNYEGFNYLHSHEVFAGQRPGIRGPVTVEQSMEERFRDCDDSRRIYYVSRKLRQEFLDHVEKNRARDTEIEDDLRRSHEVVEEEGEKTAA